MIYTNRALKESESDSINMKSLVTPQQVTKFSWDVVTPRIIRADQPVIVANQSIYINAIIDAIHEPIIILDKELTIQSANKAFFKKFKVTKKSMFGKPLFLQSNINPQAKKLMSRLKKFSRSNTSFEEL